MHELAVMAQSIDEMKVNIAWITECFCSGVIVVTNLVDNKLIFITTNCLSFYEHELLEFLRTRIFRITRILSLWLFSLSLIYIRFVWFVFVLTPNLVFFKSRVFRGHPSATPVGFSSSLLRGQRRFRCSSQPWVLQPGQCGSLLAQTRHRR